MSKVIEGEVLSKAITGAGGGGSSGCFRKGTQIQLEHGKTISIELLNVGDEILAFDEKGEIHRAKVTVVHVHKDPQPILRVKFWRGETYITPNHWVLNQYSSFVEIGQLTNHDALVDGMGHLRPIMGAEYVGNEPVYNLTVEPHHTFIADEIRVHNGGHRERVPVVGAGGGGGSKSSKGGGGRAAIEDPDSLQSRATITLIDLLGEGEIGGLVNGAKSIYLNDTPLMSDSGTYNFSNTSWDFRSGTPHQSVIPGSEEVSSPEAVGVEIKYSAPQTFTITNPNADRVRIIVNVGSLISQDKKTGGVHGSSVSYKFEVGINGAQPTAFGSPVTISGKTRSKYQRSHILTLPKPATSWTIRVVRTTPDSTSSSVQNPTYLDSYVVITDAKLNYPNSALAMIKIDPQTFSSVPRRSYLVDGLYIQVPSNYNAAAKTYSGIWDGTFKAAISSNPAWILYDLLTNKRYGLGNHVAPSQVNVAALYVIGQYCDEKVNDGYGGQEPRFEINTSFQTRAEAYKLISDISSVFRGMTYWNGGLVNFSQDSPKNPTMVYSQANVLDGTFNYTGSSRKDRHSVVLVTYNDPTANYKQRVEYVEDKELIDLLGIRQSEVIAFGCTSKGQANRMGRWLLYTERFESNMINFAVGLDSSLVIPGEVVKIHDAFRAGKRMSGRIQAITATSVTLDAPITLANAGAIITMRLPDGSFADRTVLQAAGDHTVLTWSGANPLAALPLLDAMFVVSEPTLVPMLARVIAVRQSKKENKNVLEVTAIEHNPSKYGAIENNLKLEAPPTSIVDPFEGDPSNLVFEESTYFIAPGVIGSKVHISWEGAAKYFEVSYRTSGDGLYDSEGQMLFDSAGNILTTTDGAPSSNWKVAQTKTAVFDIETLYQGDTLDVRIQAISTLDKRSNYLAGSFKVAGKTAPPEAPTNLTAVPSVRSINLKWSNPPDIDFSHTEIYMSLANDSSTASLVAKVYGDTYTVTGLPPAAITRYFWIKAVDTSGNKSTFNAVNGVSATTTAEADYMVGLLQNKIGADNLTTDLGTRINLIDADSSVPGSVAYRLAQEAAARGQAIVNEQTARQNADQQLTQSIAAITAGSSTGFDSGKVWYFDAGAESFTASGATLSWSNGEITITSSGANPQLLSPASLDITGSTYPVIKARIRRVAGSGWNGALYYSTTGHGMSASFRKVIDAPSSFAIGESAIVDFDMSQLTAGGTDWTSNTITQIRLDLGASASDVIAVDWIAIGRNGPAASTAMVADEKTARIAADNSLANSISTVTTTVNGHTSTLQTQQSSINGINAKYSVKIDNNGYVTGFGLLSESNNGAVVSSFQVRADSFSITNPAGPGAGAPITPFTVLTTPTTIDGTLYQPGTYMQAAMITKLVASQIDTRGLSIKDALGNTILSAGSPLDYSSSNISNKPTSVSQINTQEGLALSTVAADFSEAFDGLNAALNWERLQGSGEVAVITSTASTYGGKVLQVGNNSGNDLALLVHKRLMPFDQTRQYRVRARVRRSAGTGGSFSIGFVGVAADGTTLIDINGANSSSNQHYHCASNQSPLTVFQEYVGYTAGVAATGTATAGSLATPGKMHQNVKYIRPAIFVNIGGVSGVYEIDSFILESISGAVTWASLPDKPTSLSGINASEGTKLTNIQSGATRNVFTGSWVDGANYLPGDIVMDSLGYGWSSQTMHTATLSNKPPVYPITSNSDWKLYVVKGTDSLTVMLSNDTHSLPSSNTGAVTSYLGSGTDINVFEGAVELVYDGVGTSNGTWTVTSVDVNVTRGAISDMGNFARVADHTGVAAGTDTSSVTYVISGKRMSGAEFTLAKKQTLTKSKAGASGANGADAAAYWMISNAVALQKSTSNVFTPASITFSGIRQTGASAPAAYAGRFKIYENGSATAIYTSSTDESSRTYTPSSSSVTSIKAEFYLAGGTSNKLDEQIVVVVADGNGTSGVNGTRTAILEMYQWAASAPTTFPTGNSTYTWSTGQFTNPATLNGWSQTPSAPVQGQTLWICRTLYADNATTATSTVTWSATAAYPTSMAGIDGQQGMPGNDGDPGQPGENGTRTAFIELYRWSATSPTSFPIGSSTYTWATGAFTAPATLNGWSLLPGPAVEGQTLWAVGRSYADNLTSPTSTITWPASPTPYAIGAAGTSGANAIVAILSNESHVFPASADGAVTNYTGSGTKINVFDGVTELDYDGVGTANGKFKVTAVVANINAPTYTDSANGVTVNQHAGVTAGTDVSSIIYTIQGKSLTGASFSINKQQSFSKSKTGASGSSLSITSSRTPVFTSVDNVLEGSQTSIVLTAIATDVANPSYVWTFEGFQNPPTNSAAQNQVITPSNFGTSQSARVICTVNGTYSDTINIVRLNRSTAEPGATNGATIGVNVGGKITPDNASTFIDNAAINSAMIGSIDLVGANAFKVKTQLTGARMEMDGQVIKVYDTSGQLRVRLGNLTV